MLFFDFAMGDLFGSQVVVVVLLKVFMLFLVQVVVLPTFGGALGYMEMLREKGFVQLKQIMHWSQDSLLDKKVVSWETTPKKKQKKYTPGN